MAHDVFERRHEILVAGGGLCGFGAAMAASRAGRGVLLVDRRTTIGWEITWACQNQLSQASGDGGGLAQELYDRLAARGAARDGVVSPAAAEIELFQMVEEAGIELLLGAVPLAPVVEDGRVCGLLVGGKSGQHLLACDTLIDAGDNMHLAEELGLPVEQSEGVSGRMTLVLNCLPELPAEGLKLGRSGMADDITVMPGVFGGEAFVSFAVNGRDVTAAYLAAPDALAAVRQQPLLKFGLVTSIGPELMPMGATHYAAAERAKVKEGFAIAHPGASGAGGAVDSIGAATGLAELLALGEQVGRQAAANWQASEVSPKTSAGSLLPHGERLSADVIVVGGGTAGPLAAIAAARQGAEVVLLESMSYLGGMATGGGIHNYYHGITGGLQDEVDSRTSQLASLFLGDAELIGRSPDGLIAGFHPEAKKIALLQLAREAGVDLRFNSTMTGVMTEPVGDGGGDGETHAVVKHTSARAGKKQVKVVAALAADDSGMHVYGGKAFIDCTGDGDVAAMAGADFIMGREGDGLLHAFSQSCGRLAPVGEIKSEEAGKAGVDINRPKMVTVNFDAGYCDPDDITDLTRARQLGLRHLRKDRWADDDRWTYIAPHIGLRQGRQIIGDYQLTLSDELRGQTFSDVIGYAYSHYDNHARDIENESDMGVIWVWLLGQWRTRYGCEIPYRSLLPQGVEGLLVACRALALTADAHYQLRMQRDMQRIGQAAGVAAAIAAQSGVSPRQVDIGLVQDELRKMGALDEGQRPQPAVIERPPQELLNAATQGETGAVWLTGFRAKELLPAVRAKLGSDSVAVRFWSSVILAMAGDDAGAGELRLAVRDRRENKPDSHRAAPQWQAAMVLLGRIRDKQSVPVLAEVLNDSKATMAGLVAATRALGRIGDPAGVEAVKAMLSRDDISTDRCLQVSGGVSREVVEPARWQLDLAAAEALARMGRGEPEIARKYLSDDRAYVRRYARRVLETGPVEQSD